MSARLIAKNITVLNYTHALSEKRKAAQKAEADFFALLKEKAKITESSTWKDVKKGLDKDLRYDAVGSSSLREELFNTYCKTLAGSSRLPMDTKNVDANEDATEERKRKDRERKERAVRERDEQVQRNRKRVETELARSRRALTREEGELDFLCAFSHILFFVVKPIQGANFAFLFLGLYSQTLCAIRRYACRNYSYRY